MKLNYALRGLLLALAYQHVHVQAKCPFADMLQNQQEGHMISNHRHTANNNREETANEARRLQTACNGDFVFTTALCEQIQAEVAEIGNNLNANNGDRGRFYGGILRLAAHDFMDFDRNAVADEQEGSDGCLIFTEEDNIGLEATWVGEGDTLVPAIQALYESIYEPMGMSRADYWVAIANAVVKAASPNQILDLPFRYGRHTSEDCSFSIGRQPKANGCSDVEEVFINRMGVTWRDATALMGGHTLGAGSASTHVGIWDNTR